MRLEMIALVCCRFSTLNSGKKQTTKNKANTEFSDNGYFKGPSHTEDKRMPAIRFFS